MFRTIGDRPSSWESRLPPEVLRLPEELVRVDALLDDPAFFAPFAPHFHPVIGRPSTPAEWYLRLMFLKFRYRLGYESLCAEVSDSISWRRFCRIPLDGWVPHPTTLMKLTARCGEGAVAGLNEALLTKAAGARLLRTARLRADTTVIPANVVYPADSGLLARAVGKLVRAARRVQAAGGTTGTVMTGRRRAAARRVREIAARLRSRAKVAREESSTAIARVTGELAGLAEKTAAQASAVLRDGRRAVPKAIGGRVRGRLRRALDELAVTIGRTATIVAQARARLAGQMPDGATRLVSLHDPGAADPQGAPGQAGRVRVQGAGHRQRRRHCRGLRRGVRRRPARPAAGARHQTGRPPRRPCRAQSPPTAATARPPPNVTCTPRACAPSRFPARPRPHRPARHSSTAAASAGWLSGAPDAKDGLATSSADTAGTAPAWTAGKEQPSGAGTGYSPATWSRSAPWLADPPRPASHMPAASTLKSAFRLFQVEVASRSGPARPAPD